MKDSIDDLEKELVDYRKQKEKVEKIVNLIGGKKGFKRMIVIDTILIISLVVIFLLDLAHHIFGLAIAPGLLTLEVGVLLISVKVLWIAHKRNQSEHFMFWFLSSLDSKLNLTIDEIRELKDELKSKK
ncbi:MAG: hypothetical protein OCD02_00015 [Spirochaetaceae bacterium]